MHARGLIGHLGKDGTIPLVGDRFNWPSLKRDVYQIVSQCCTIQLAKTKRYKSEPYTSLPIPHAP